MFGPMSCASSMNRAWHRGMTFSDRLPFEVGSGGGVVVESKPIHGEPDLGQESIENLPDMMQGNAVPGKGPGSGLLFPGGSDGIADQGLKGAVWRRRPKSALVDTSCSLLTVSVSQCASTAVLPLPATPRTSLGLPSSSS